MKNKRWTDSEFESAKQLLVDGKSYKEIGELLKRTPKAVKLYLNRKGFGNSEFFVSFKLTVFCKTCNKELIRNPSEITGKNNFCSQKCSYAFNKDKLITTITKTGKYKLLKTCGVCSKEFVTDGTSAKYCSKECMRLNFKQITNLKVEQGLTKSPPIIKEYLYEKRGKCCEICGLETWQDKNIVFILDHINGDSTNNNLDNLRLLCPNCDSQTDTFKGKNVGNGRHSRRERYRQGLSY